MRVAVIRGDVPSPIFLADLEPTSQFNPPTEPFGQTQYIEYPSATALTYLMKGVYVSYTEDYTIVGDIGDDVNDQFTASVPNTLPIPAGSQGYGGVPAAVISSSAITFPVTIGGGTNTLAVANSSPPSYTSVVIASGVYATMTALLTAINAVLVPTGLANAVSDSTGLKVVIQSSVPGPGSFIELGGATDTTTLFLASGQTFTMPSAATIIAALNPVVAPPATGSLNVSAAALLTNVGPTPNSSYVANFIAPQFLETTVAVQSYQAGNLHGYLLPTWNPNPRLLPAITSGPAIQVVENDGTTPFSSSPLAPFPMITAAVHNSPNTGDITITGVGLGNAELFNSTVVRVTAASSVVVPGSGAGLGGLPFVRLTQAQIISAVTDGVALTGTFDVTEGSPTVLASISQAGLLFPGNQVVFEAQPDKVYEVSTVVTTTITLTTNYTGPSNLYTTADSPVTQGVVTNTSVVIPAKLLTTTTGIALGVAGSTVELSYGTFANANSGAAATITAFNPTTGVVTVGGLTNQFASQVGNANSITMSGSANPGNNGTFEIVGWVSSSSILIQNFLGVSPDSGLTWSEKPPVAFIVT
jgi:hypothetical protein